MDYLDKHPCPLKENAIMYIQIGPYCLNTPITVISHLTQALQQSNQLVMFRVFFFILIL
jgi:hypothetical protein